MTWLWIVLAVAALIGAALVLRTLAKALAAARQLQRTVNVLSEQVTAEVQRLGDDVAELGDSLDDVREK